MRRSRYENDMIRNPLREKLDQGKTVTGMLSFIGAPMVVELMARAGLDFVVIDMEQSPLDLDRLAHIVRAADAAGIAPFVRVPELNPSLITRILNLGISGIVLPHANRERCEALVQAVLYAPDGQRGACPIVRATRYWPNNWKDYAAHANREIIIMPLLEDKEAIEDFEALAAIPGIDTFFIGPYDLSVSVGVPGAGFDHPVMSEALDKVSAIARANGKRIFTTVGDRQEKAYTQNLIERGVSGVIFATDGLVFLKACQNLIANVED
jgi:4-hydroxy-2-oxoheptanedioate aldolase